MNKMLDDMLPNFILPPRRGVLLGIRRFHSPDGQGEVLRVDPDFMSKVYQLKWQSGIWQQWIVKPDDPRDHPFAVMEDTKYGIVIWGRDDQIKWFLRKAGSETGFSWAIARFEGSPNLSLIPTVRRGPKPLDLGDAEKVPLLRAIGNALKMHPPGDAKSTWDLAPDLRELVVRDQLTFFTGIGFEAERKRRKALEAEQAKL